MIAMLREKSLHMVVLGAGRSGVAATKLLLARGHRVTLADDNTRENLRYLNESGLTENDALNFAFNRTASLEKIDGLLISPGIAPTHPLLHDARHRMLPMISEIDLAMAYVEHQKILASPAPMVNLLPP